MTLSLMILIVTTFSVSTYAQQDLSKITHDSLVIVDYVDENYGMIGLDFISGRLGDVAGELTQRLKEKALEILDNSVLSINDTVTQIPALFDQAMNFVQTRRRDPLVFDLDDDGVELVSLDESGVQFDFDNDNIAEATGWVSADDGLLVYDRNGNGQIDNISELFGSETQTGFEELKAFDSNNDNVIDSQDTQFGELRMWRDLNQNGISEANELQTLDEIGITSISLNAIPTSYAIENNLVIEEGAYTTTDGSTYGIAEVLFAVDQLNSSFSGSAAGADNIDIETLFMPYSRGYGNLPSWHVAMTN